MAKQTALTEKQPAQHHFFRTMLAAMLGWIAVSLIITSIMVLWLSRTLTDTEQYVKTVSTLVSSPEVQDFVATKASEALLDIKEAPVKEIASELLTKRQRSGKSEAELKELIKPRIEQNIHTVLASSSFATLWENTNRTIHAKLIEQLESDSQGLELDFQPVIKGVVDELGKTDLRFVKDKLKIKGEAGKLKIASDSFDDARNGYRMFKKSVIFLLLSAAVALVLCVLVSVHHLKTLWRIAILTGISCLIFLALLNATSVIGSSKLDPEQTRLAISIFESVTQPLRNSLVVVGVLSTVIGVGGKIYETIKTRRSLPTKK